MCISVWGRCVTYVCVDGSDVRIFTIVVMYTNMGASFNRNDKLKHLCQ